MTGAAMIQVEQLLAEAPEHARLDHDPAFAAGAGWVDGAVVPLSETRIPITDLGFMRADAVYDVVSVSRGQFFRLDDHQDRFARSCERMRLVNPLNREDEAQALNDMVAAAGLQDAYVWWCVTRGANPASPIDRLNPSRFANRFYGFAVPYIFIKGDAERTAGIDLWISQDYIRIPRNAVDPRAKNFCSLDLAMSLFEAGRAGSTWSVLTDGNGVLTESPGCNVFIVKDGVVATPDLGCLEGITRQTALELSAELQLKVEERTVAARELEEADEAFLTSSAGGIMPVSRVNGQALCDGAGPVSRRLHDLYWQRRWDGWHGTPVSYS